MPIFYNKVERRNLSDAKAPKLWYPVLKSTGMVKEREVARLLSEETTLNPKEAEMAVYQLFKVVSRLLLDGRTVQLSELGSFHLTVHSHGVPAEAEVSASQIERVTVRFSESVMLKEAVGKAVFKDAASLTGK
jgi:predicted histone-like DNA-binding protein